MVIPPRRPTPLQSTVADSEDDERTSYNSEETLKSTIDLVECAVDVETSDDEEALIDYPHGGLQDILGELITCRTKYMEERERNRDLLEQLRIAQSSSISEERTWTMASNKQRLEQGNLLPPLETLLRFRPEAKVDALLQELGRQIDSLVIFKDDTDPGQNRVFRASYRLNELKNAAFGNLMPRAGGSSSQTIGYQELQALVGAAVHEWALRPALRYSSLMPTPILRELLKAADTNRKSLNDHLRKSPRPSV